VYYSTSGLARDKEEKKRPSLGEEGNGRWVVVVVVMRKIATTCFHGCFRKRSCRGGGGE
jgi:hypothetical protein